MGPHRRRHGAGNRILATTITIAVPTHNRATTLGDTLRSLCALAIPSGAALDCVVVDNGSTDSTPAVVEEAARSAPFPIRRVFEARLGSSHARNRAVQETRADLIFFIDDDATAEPSWAAEMMAEIERRGLDAACGMVLPEWSVPPPPWLGKSLWVRLAVHDREKIEGQAAREAENLANYFSANVGLRRTTFERFGMFREDLGVVGDNPISGEDTELFARIVERGGAMGFAPRAIVHHRIPAARMTPAYLRRKSFAFGVGSGIVGGRHHNRLDKLVRNAARMTVAAMRGDRERTIYHELECANFFGYWRGRIAAARGAAPLTSRT
jgi:glycosyltransferase involved in cell wall biosynthesis